MNDTARPHPPTRPSPRRGDPPDRSRAGAIWVTATGAALILAAAAVFVAVQWDHIPDAVKLAALGLVCGSCLMAGRGLRRQLPATSGVLYHLGAFLIPVVVAAGCVHVGTDWSALLLVEGVASTASFWWLDRVERSVVLEWATTTAAVVLAGGLAATTGLPAPVALVTMAGAAELTGARRRAVAWAATAALAPLGALALSAVHLGPGVLVRLGLTSSLPRLTSIAVGLVAAVVIGREAGRRRSLPLVVLAGLAAATGVVDGWVSVVHDTPAHLVGLATLFVLAELVAQGVAGDPFWGRPARAVAGSLEVVAATVGLFATVVAEAVVTERWSDELAVVTRPAVLVAGSLAVVGWFVADLRRRQPDSASMGIALLVGAGWAPATVAMAVTALTTVALGLGAPLLVGVAAVVVASFLVLGGRDGADVMALVLVVPAPFLAGHHPPVAAGLALCGALLLAAVTVIRASLARHTAEVETVWLLALSTTLPVVVAGVATFGHVDVLAATTTAALVLWAASLVLDCVPDDDRFEGVCLAPRSAALLTLLAAPAMTAGGLAVLSGLLAGLALVDAVARRRPLMAVQTAILAPLSLGMAMLALGASTAAASLTVIGLCVAATAIDPLVSADWRSAARLGATSAAFVALTIAGPDRSTLATLLIVLGGLGIAWAVRLATPDIAVLGGFIATVGIWLHLVDHGVRVSEPYLAPVAAGLLVAGWWWRRTQPLSSWVAYGPALALFGGAALVERAAGGGVGHALVAGVVGLVAVVVGGQRRLIAPLFLGTALLVGVTVHESLAVTAGVPTWAWLGLGGTVLVAAGIVMERTDHGPVETGRRVLDVVAERFS